MAISLNGARFIARTVKNGVALGKLVTVGRQGLYVPKSYVNALIASTGLGGGYSLGRGDPGFPGKKEWADEMYTHFGANSVTVLDGSDYEGAELVHDLNAPLPRSLTNNFDCLLDGGTLEHVFNVPEAISSYMKLVKVGGHVVLLDMPATNACGHGFYQFSPTFFWQVFSKRYGFEIVDILVVKADSFSPFWHVGNPAELRRRVELVSNATCYIYLVAKKIAEFRGLTPMPIQDDYMSSWAEPKIKNSESEKQLGLKAWAQKLLVRYAPMAYWKLTNSRNAAKALAQMTLGGSSERNPYTQVGD